MEQIEIVTAFSSLDTQAPVINALITSTGATTAIEGSTVLIMADTSDKTGVAFVQFYLNGNLVATDTENSFTYSLFLSPDLGAAATVTAVAVDVIGNRSEPVSINLSILTNQPPAVVISSVSDTTVTQGQKVNIVVVASDDIGLTQINLLVNDGILANLVKSLSGSISSKIGFEYQVPADFPIGSSLRLKALAQDTLNLAGASQEVNLTVIDVLPPVVSIGTPVDGSIVDPGDMVSVFVQAEDSGNIKQVSLSAAGPFTSLETRNIIPEAAQIAEVFSFQIPLDAPQSIPLIITATAVDAANNIGTKIITLSIGDNSPPVVSIATASGILQVAPGEQAEIEVTATDATGVTNVTLDVVGVEMQARDIASTLQTKQNFSFGVTLRHSRKDLRLLSMQPLGTKKAMSVYRFHSP